MDRTKEKTKIKNFTVSLCLLLVLAGFGLAGTVQAARLYLSPPSGTYTVGSSFSVSVMVASTDQAMNAVSADVSFPSDKLEIVSLSKDGSMMSLWVQEPAFSNPGGTFSGEGIVLNPGFTGSAGKVLSAKFKAEKAGTATLSFSSGSVLANDGQGTEILTAMTGAQFEIKEAIGTPVTLTPETPSVPRISSPTHPDSNKWYANNNPKFSWVVPEGVSEVRLLANMSSDAAPTVGYSPPVSSKELSALSDGVWYFHARFKNAAGLGPVAHYRFQIDITKPERFTIQELPKRDRGQPTTQFSFDAYDKTSGIDHYEVQIDDREPEQWTDDGTHTYTTPSLTNGRYTLTAKAVDKAGNALEKDAGFAIEGVETLPPPVITSYPKKLRPDQSFNIKGTATPGVKVILWFQQGDQDAERTSAVQTDRGGNFTRTSDEGLDKGTYKVWAEAINDRGVRSEPSEAVSIAVGWFFEVDPCLINLIGVAITLIVFFGLIIWYKLRKFMAFKKKLRREIKEAENALHKVFSSLKRDLRQQLKKRKRVKTKKQLLEKEEDLMEQYQKDLERAEESVAKEIEDIKEELENGW